MTPVHCSSFLPLDLVNECADLGAETRIMAGFMATKTVIRVGHC